MTLTRPQCTYIQAPAIQATLSKLHLNRNTSRAIVFGPSSYAGLDLPELYTTEGTGQLRLLLGHLRLRDKTARLILIDLSYLQLLTGSSTLFLNLPYKRYGHCTEQGWLVSIWKFLNKINFKILIRQAFVPTPPRQHDTNLMDFFVTQGTSHKTLKILNRCRVHLQVLFLSDICSADGTTILQECKQGQHPKDRHVN